MTRWLKKNLFWATMAFPILAFVAGYFPHPTIDLSIRLILAFYLAAVFFRAVFFFFGSFREKVEDYLLDKMPSDSSAKPFVSIIVPCYNEEKVIPKSLENLMNLDYPFYEVIVVNDGSRDNTLGIADWLSSQAETCSVRVVSQPNQGKAAALNHGLLYAAGDIILCVDADSKIRPGSIAAGVRHFRDPEVGAVAGFVEIANQNNLLLQLQQLEYLVGLNFSRRALSFMGVVPIVPGPAGLFRREAIFEAGGFQSKEPIFAEDAELSLRVLANGWKIKSEEDMIAVTEAPEDVPTLLRQRYRWNRGTVQALMMNLKKLMYGSGWRGRWVGGYLFTEAILTPVLNLGLILYFLGYFFKTGVVYMFTIWYMYLLAVDLLTTVIATHTRGNLHKWIALTIINKVYYYYMLLTWRILALLEEWRDEKMIWDKIERTGHLEEAA